MYTSKYKLEMIVILIAWIRFLFTRPSKEERRRASICVSCRHSRRSKFLALVKGKLTDVQGLYCRLCSCPLVAKIKTKEKKHICYKWN